jgi:tRNA(Ile)-lysidine synthase
VRPFIDRVAACIAAHEMISPGQMVLVALSAGADSTALLHALWRLSDRLHLRVCACHVHHGLRGADADADADHAAAFADSLGVMCSIVRADVPAYAKANKLSLEEAARVVRYQLLEQASRACSAAKIATGHTADDQAETVLLNILRGAGPAGLAGIPPVRDGIIRPLLEVTRADVEEYCRAENVAYRVDASNRDLRFTRNRIRHEVMPALKQVQPNAVAALCRLAEIMREENAWTGAMGADVLARIATESEIGIGIPLSELQTLPRALVRRVLREAVAQVKGDARDLELERVDALAALAESGRTGAIVELPGGWRAERTYDQIVIEGETAPSPELTGEWQLPVPGEVTIADLGLRITAALSDDLMLPRSADEAVLDAGAVRGPLMIRTWRPGDRFHPLGAPAPTKLQDFFVNAKIPRALRRRVALVLCGDEVVWLAGHRISERYKVTEQTKRSIRLAAHRLT